jgi:hypothetical protein
MTPRCIQCSWTIAPDRQEDITDNDGNTIPLHRGGCPVDARMEKAERDA